MSNWICCQIGAREHYAIPRALHENGQLAHMITDAWVPPQSPLEIFPFLSTAALRERFHPGLSQASVQSFTFSLIGFELTQRLQKRTGWKQIISRNHWFQQQAIKTLAQLAPGLTTPPVLFSYSYAALELFRFAKQQGWYTVLGQIDPGIQEEVLVAQEYERYPAYRSDWEPAPCEYWQTWREECTLADSIVVNSHWSRQLLQKAGVNSDKIRVVPLVYTPPAAAANFIRTYPQSFSVDRPLKVLFLGQVIFRKGIAAVLSAVELLFGYPVEFWIVGAPQIDIPPHLQSHPQIHWVGHVNRSQTSQYYQMADVFLFPTFSDGFGLTQLEAQAWKLPIIASRNCGEVVVDGVNGWILKAVSGEEIAQLLKACLRNRAQFNTIASPPNHINNFSFTNLFQQLKIIR